jgi:hypothetical protein
VLNPVSSQTEPASTHQLYTQREIYVANLEALETARFVGL